MWLLYIILFGAGLAALQLLNKEAKKSISNSKKQSHKRRKSIRDYELEKALNEVKSERKLNENEWSELREYIELGKHHEKKKEYRFAINFYKAAYDFGRESETLSIYNFAQSIHRLIILYGKVNELKELELLLKEVIKNYPDYRDIPDWENRLNKVRIKNLNK